MIRLLYVGVGGFLGSVARYLLGGMVQQLSRSVGFPWGTLAVNLLGCFAIGVISHLADVRGVPGADARLFLVVGVLGGFTTFSAFGNETMNLLAEGQSLAALGNVTLNVVAGVALVWAGRAAAIALWR